MDYMRLNQVHAYLESCARLNTTLFESDRCLFYNRWAPVSKQVRSEPCKKTNIENEIAISNG